MKKIILTIVGISVLGLFGYTLFFLYQKSKPKPVIYKTEQPVIINIFKKTVATGSVMPRKEIKLKPIVSGVVENIFSEPGEYVKAGDIIAKIKINPNLANLNNAENQLNKAKLSYNQAKIDYERNEKLYSEKVIAYTDYYTSLVTFNKAKEDVTAAENSVSIIKVGASKQSGRQSNVVKATASGMILDVPVKQGFFVIESNSFNDGTTIATLADMNEMIFEGDIDESEVGKIKKGMDIELTIGAIENKKYHAKLEFISPIGALDEGAVKFTIRAAIHLEKNEFLRAGYSASADIILDKKENVLAISEGLLQFGKDSTFVEVETNQPQVFEKRLVKVGISDGINTEITSGISKTDKIKVIVKEAPPVAPIPAGGKPK